MERNAAKYGSMILICFCMLLMFGFKKKQSPNGENKLSTIEICSDYQSEFLSTSFVLNSFSLLPVELPTGAARSFVGWSHNGNLMNVISASLLFIAVLMTQKANSQSLQNKELKVQETPNAEKQEFSKLIEEMPDSFLHGKVELDREGNPNDWTFLNVNRAYEEEAGCSRHDVIGRRVSKVFPRAMSDEANWVGRYGTVALTGKSDRMTGFSSLLGKWYEVNVYSPKKGEFASIFKNVTDRVVTEEKLRVSNERFRNIFECATIGILVLNANGKIVIVNSYGEKLFGYQEGELAGKKVEQLVPEHLSNFHRDHRESYFHNPKVRAMGAGLELQALRKNGKEVPVEISLSYYSTDNDTLAMAFISDITERKESQREGRKYLADLEHKVQERTADLRKSNQELESFSYSVSHDLRAPLRAINGFAEALNKDKTRQLDDEAKRFLGRIRANSLKMGQLIDDLLEFSRMNRRKTKFQQVDLEILIPKVIDYLFPESTKFIHVSALPTIVGDAEMLKQVFTNLISNAVKYSSREEKPRIEILARENNGDFVISIKDNGVGFDEEYKNKIFEVFQRLHGDTEFEGTGVGLALCHKIIRAHHGEIWAESTIGEGAVFHVKLKKTDNPNA
ncbi:MAG: PAS domain S-box protein [Cyclobacteriaceae bacterium]